MVQVQPVLHLGRQHRAAAGLWPHRAQVLQPHPPGAPCPAQETTSQGIEKTSLAIPWCGKFREGGRSFLHEICFSKEFCCSTGIHQTCGSELHKCESRSNFFF